MNFPTVQKDKEDFKRPFFEDEISQPLVKMNQTTLIIESQEDSHITEYGRKIFSNILIIAGGWFMFASSTLLFLNFVLESSSSIAQPWNQPIYFIGGLILVFLKLGKIKRKSDWLLYSIIPLMGIMFSILFNLVPNSWLVLNTFFYSLSLFYLLTLFVFYYVKGYFETFDN